MPWPYAREDAVGFVERFVPSGWRAGTELTWAIRHADQGFLGVVGITLARSDRPSGMIGFWLGAPHRGNGYLPEAARAVIDRVFDADLTDLIAWEAVIPNRASLAAARTLGFRYTGEGPATVPGRDGSRPPSWHAELRANDDREPRPGWP